MESNTNEDPFSKVASGFIANEGLRRSSSYSDVINANISNDDIKRTLLNYIHEENKTQFGLLGRLFGTEKNASKNITFTILFFIVLLICILLFIGEDSKNTHNFILNIMDKLLPLFTLAFGYFFGKQ